MQNEVHRRVHFECPVYQTSEQRQMEENLDIYEGFSIMTVLLPIQDGKHSDFWVKRGVCLVCQPADHNIASRLEKVDDKCIHLNLSEK